MTMDLGSTLLLLIYCSKCHNLCIQKIQEKAFIASSKKYEYVKQIKYDDCHTKL